MTWCCRWRTTFDGWSNINKWFTSGFRQGAPDCLPPFFENQMNKTRHQFLHMWRLPVMQCSRLRFLITICFYLCWMKVNEQNKCCHWIIIATAAENELYTQHDRYLKENLFRFRKVTSVKASHVKQSIKDSTDSVLGEFQEEVLVILDHLFSSSTNT